MKIVRPVVLLSMLAFALAGCGKDPKTIVVLGEDSANINAMEQTRKNFESEKLKLRFEKATFDDAETKAVQDFFNKSGNYDIVLQYNFLLSSFVRNEYIVPISDLRKNVSPDKLSFEKDIFPTGWKEVGYYYASPYSTNSPIQQVGYPFALNTMLMVYNKSMFEDPANMRDYAAKHAGKTLAPPRTWEELHDVAAFFTGKSGPADGAGTYGIVLQGASDGWLYYEWMNFLFGRGGRTMDKQLGWMGDRNTPVELDSPAAIDAAKSYLALKPFNAGDFITTKPEQQIDRMRTGKVAMAIMWTDYVPQLLEMSKPAGERSTQSRSFGFAPIPGNVSMIAGGAYFINKSSKNPQAAFDYVLELMQKPSQIELAKRGLASPLDSVYDDPEVKQLPYAEALRTSLRRGVYMNEAGPDATVVRVAIEKALQSAWRGGVDAKQAMTQAKAEILVGRAAVFDKLESARK